MNRVIKFRAWDGRTMSVPFGLEEALAFSNEKVMQFTGLTDKNGKEIYEGDILEEDSEWWQVQYTDRAMFEAISFPRSVDFALEEITGSATVQGNIYENPELIEKPV